MWDKNCALGPRVNFCFDDTSKVNTTPHISGAGKANRKCSRALFAPTHRASEGRSINYFTEMFSGSEAGSYLWP